MQATLELRSILNKSLYSDLLMIIGQSYAPIDDDHDNKKVKKEFTENILPKLEKKILEIAKSIKRVFAIADGASTEDILEQEKVLESATEKELEQILAA